MAVTITKKAKTKAKKDLLAPQAAEGDDLLELVDELVELDAVLAAHDAKVEKQRRRYDELKKELVQAVDTTYAEDEKAQLVSSIGKVVEVSGKSSTTTITDLAAARKMLGVETFNKIAKINLTDLRAYLNPLQLEQCTVTERKGARRLKII